MQADWTNDFTLKFLELYESERLLWDSTDKNHKYKHKHHHAWKRISEKLGNIPIKELKSKKKSLMATFRPLLKKKKVSMRPGVSDEDVFRPIWFAFEVMESFLGKIYYIEETINGKEEDLQSENRMFHPLSPSTSIHSQHNDEILKPPITQDNKNNPNSTQINVGGQSPTKKTEVSVTEAEGKDNENFDTQNNVLNRKRVEEDECEVYGKLLAKKLRKYPERMRDVMMYEIDGLLLDNPPVQQESSVFPYVSPSSPCPVSPSPMHPNEPYGIGTCRNIPTIPNATRQDCTMHSQTYQSEVINAPETNNLQDGGLYDDYHIYEVNE